MTWDSTDFATEDHDFGPYNIRISEFKRENEGHRRLNVVLSWKDPNHPESDATDLLRTECLVTGRKWADLHVSRVSLLDDESKRCNPIETPDALFNATGKLFNNIRERKGEIDPQEAVDLFKVYADCLCPMSPPDGSRPPLQELAVAATPAE